MLLFTTQDMSSYIRSDRVEGKYFGCQSTRIIFQVKKWLNKGLFKIGKMKNVRYTWAKVLCQYRKRKIR